MVCKELRSHEDDDQLTAVIGAGPAGIAAVSTLIKQERNVIWIDPHFKAGRLTSFPEVPSNTKTRLFLAYYDYCIGKDSLSRKSVVVDRMRELDGEAGCELGWAAKMCQEITESLIIDEHVMGIRGLCRQITESPNGWTVQYDRMMDSKGEETRPDRGSLPGQTQVKVKHVVLATGSVPKCTVSGPSIPTIDPEACLNLTRIKTHVAEDDIVGVVGSSHTAVLLMRNLHMTRPRPRQVYNFYVSDVRYAEYLPDGRIKHDNTGLKGLAAEWAHEHLDHDKTNCCNGWLKRKRIEKDEAFDAHPCTKLIWAIGYERVPIPSITSMNKETLEIKGVASDGCLLTEDDQRVEGLKGMGIAFPQLVIDPSGATEAAVGLWKFVKTAREIL